MNIKKINIIIDKYWDMAIKSLHDTAPRDKDLTTTSGKVEDNIHNLYEKHRKYLKELFGEEENEDEIKNKENNI